MDRKKSFSPSPLRILLISTIIFIVMCLIFAFSRGSFELKGFGLGAVFGAIFALFPLIYGFGQKIEIIDKEINYSSNLLVLLSDKFKKRLLLSEINEVRLGTPKFNKTVASFAAINISSFSEEITFNPDLFDNSTLRSLFQELKDRNSNIKFDNYAFSLIEKGKGSGIFRKMVLGNFMWSVLLIISIGVISLLLFKLRLISKEVVLVISGAQIIFVPIIFNWLANTFKKKRVE